MKVLALSVPPRLTEPTCMHETESENCLIRNASVEPTRRLAAVKKLHRLVSKAN